MIAVAEKTCRLCGRSQSLSNYYRTETGHRGTCKSCHKVKVGQTRKRRQMTKAAPRAQEGWRLVMCQVDGGEGMSVYLKGLVIKFDRISNATNTRTANYAIVFDDSGRRFDSEEAALREIG